jgi:hypothetical protein
MEREFKTPEYIRRCYKRYYEKNKNELKANNKEYVKQHCDICDKDYNNIYTHYRTIAHQLKCGIENPKQHKKYHCDCCNIDTSNLTQHQKTKNHLNRENKTI